MSGSVPPVPENLQPGTLSGSQLREGIELGTRGGLGLHSRMPLDPTPCPWCPNCGGARVTLTLRSTNGAYCLCPECGHCWYHQRSQPVPMSPGGAADARSED